MKRLSIVLLLTLVIQALFLAPVAEGLTTETVVRFISNDASGIKIMTKDGEFFTVQDDDVFDIDWTLNPIWLKVRFVFSPQSSKTTAGCPAYCLARIIVYEIAHAESW